MNLEQHFQQALNAFNNGDLNTASGLCSAMLVQAPTQPDAQHLMALVCKQQGRLVEAEEHFRASLKANPRQPAVHSNLANLLQQSRRFPEADAAYDRAVTLMPKLADAWYNRGKMALEQGRHEKAIFYLQKARSFGANINTDLTLIKAFQDAGQVQQAQTLSANVRKHYAGDVRGVIAHANIMRLSDEAAALQFLETQLVHSNDPATINYELGLLHYANDNFEAAISQFEMVLARKPEMIEAHRSLNNLLWQQEDARYLSSYRQAIEKRPTQGNLYHNLAAAYISAGEDEAAIAVLREALKRAGRDPYLVQGLAVQELKQGNWDVAEALMKESMQSEPDNVRFLVNMADLFIKKESYAEAARYLTHALSVQPHNQELWAYQGLLWRLTDDPRHDWLNDYDNLLKAYELPVPKGFESLPVFMSELAAYLSALHTSKRQPLDQSVRNGTQSLGMLFNRTNPLVAGIRQSVEMVLQDYLSGMQPDANHPFYSRLGKSTRFTGSWSVKLRSGGYHVNHVHPYGWLSCCNYIALPPLGDESTGSRAGWIRFGETSLQLGEREKTASAIKPEVGKCVFFPSYFWHGTYEFDSEQPRMTVPCDIDPI